MFRAIVGRKMGQWRYESPAEEHHPGGAIMVSPSTIIEFGIMRHRELQAENALYRRSAQAVQGRRPVLHHFAHTRDSVASILIILRTRLRNLLDAEHLLEAFARMDNVHLP
jgi:hypothetical protein